MRLLHLCVELAWSRILKTRLSRNAHIYPAERSLLPQARCGYANRASTLGMNASGRAMAGPFGCRSEDCGDRKPNYRLRRAGFRSRSFFAPLRGGARRSPPLVISKRKAPAIGAASMSRTSITSASR